MELTTAARKMLLAQADVTGYVQMRVTKHSLLEPVTGTGRSAVVVRQASGWATPDPVQTAEYPLLAVECWADCSRTVDGDPLQDDSIDRALALYRVVDGHLHGKRDVMWGGLQGLRVLSSARDGEPRIWTAKDVKGRGAPDFGDSAMVEVLYRVHTHH